MVIRPPAVWPAFLTDGICASVDVYDELPTAAPGLVAAKNCFAPRAAGSYNSNWGYQQAPRCKTRAASKFCFHDGLRPVKELDSRPRCAVRGFEGREGASGSAPAG